MYGCYICPVPGYMHYIVAPSGRERNTVMCGKHDICSTTSVKTQHTPDTSMLGSFVDLFVKLT